MLPKLSATNTLSSGSTVFGCYTVFIVPALQIYTVIKTTSVDDARLPAVGVAGWPVILTGWPVTVGVVEVGVVDTRYGVSQPGADAER